MKLYYLDTGSKGVREGYIEVKEIEDTYELAENDLGVFAISKSDLKNGVYYGFWKRQPTYYIGFNRGIVIDYFIHRAENDLEEHLDAIERIREDIKKVKDLLSITQKNNIDISEIPQEILQKERDVAKKSDSCGTLEEMHLSTAFSSSDIYAEGYALGFWKIIGINKTKLSRLVTKLMLEHKYNTVMQVANEPDFCKKMYEKYNIPDKGEVEIEGILKNNNRLFDKMLRYKTFDYATLAIMAGLTKEEIVEKANSLEVYDDSMANSTNGSEGTIMKIIDKLLKRKNDKYSELAIVSGLSKEEIHERAILLGVYEVSLDN